jgi:hypothetical protein
MKRRPEDMLLFDLDYGDLIRPSFRILRSHGWAQCTNQTQEHLIVYGPKHDGERSIFDTSPYVLPPGSTTPDSWDCEGFFLPSDRFLQAWRGRRHGPLASKFRNFRRFWVKSLGADTYTCPWNNGVFKPSQINWAIPNFSYQEITTRLSATCARKT